MKVLYLWWQFYYKGYNSGTGKYRKTPQRKLWWEWRWGSFGGFSGPVSLPAHGFVHQSGSFLNLIILSFLKSRFHYLGLVKSLTIGSWTQSPTLEFICGILQGTLPHKSFKILVKSYLNNSRNTVSYVGLCVTKICFFFASARESNYRGFD